MPIASISMAMQPTLSICAHTLILSPENSIAISCQLPPNLTDLHSHRSVLANHPAGWPQNLDRNLKARHG
jgi:hypothetical protein